MSFLPEVNLKYELKFVIIRSEQKQNWGRYVLSHDPITYMLSIKNVYTCKFQRQLKVRSTKNSQIGSKEFGNKKLNFVKNTFTWYCTQGNDMII